MYEPDLKTVKSLYRRYHFRLKSPGKLCGFAAVFVIMIAFPSCPGTFYGYKYNTGNFPVNPVNMTEFNSAYYDYNMSSPVLGEIAPLIFSSSRGSQGAHFDLVYMLQNIEFSKDNGKLAVYNERNYRYDVVSYYGILRKAVAKTSSAGDELGPFLIEGPRIYRDTILKQDFGEYVLLYSGGEGNNQDILFTENISDREFTDPVPVSFLNTGFNDMYPAFSENHDLLWLCSDRSGNFDIYNARLGLNWELMDILLGKKELNLSRVESVSSTGNDKCPYQAGDILVFASDRPGGFGGFDLYYSVKTGEDWSAPVNFGEKINTSYNEYRPILKPFSRNGEFSNDYLAFSSDRPGGSGGYDLYYCGVNLP